MEYIKTKFYDDVDKNCPLNEYPRPQMTRANWQNLNGEFLYAIGNSLDVAPNAFNDTILVPFAIESQLSGVCKQLKPGEILWYSKKFTVDESIKNDRILLHFGAVDWKCKVYINGTLVGEHVGGYVPFALDITDALNDKENELRVAVYDPTDEGWQQRGKQTLESHGFWYTATSGIWQTVWMEGVSSSYVKNVKLLPDIDNDTLKADLAVVGSADKIIAEVMDGDKVILKQEIQASDVIKLSDYECWTPENPKLYDLRITLFTDGKETDTVTAYFGMRKFSIRKITGIPRLCLNNEPYFHNGLLDQGYWCDGGMTPPTDEAMIYDIAKMKELGFNMLRKHIKVEPARWYYHCDRLGMLVWQDMVSGGKPVSQWIAGVLPNLSIDIKDNKYKAFSREKPEWREDFRRELFEVIDSLYNTVSLCCWVPFNEGWGQFDAYEIGHAVKRYDPSRHVDHASGWHDQHGPEFRSIHRYIVPVTMPGRKEGRPFVLSEFGGYSRIIDGHVWNKKKSFGYVMFTSEKALSKAYKILFKTQIIPLIKKGLCATVYTQVSDVEFEVNGILTYDRKLVKLDESMLKEINAQMRY